jgi:hypothetical protein
MTLIKKIDVEVHFAARRRRRRAAAGFASQPDGTACSGIKAVGPKANVSGFKEDFALEHSSSCAPVTPAK